MFRSPTNPATDREVFRRTASRTKKINLGAITFRGGVRL